MREKIETFLSKKKKEINRIAELYPEEKSLFIDYEELERYDRELAEELIQNPDEVISAFEDVLSGLNIPTIVENPKCHVRFHNLPKEKGYSLMVRNITSDYIGKFMAVEGIVNRISDILPKVSVARFYCNKCGELHDEPQPTRFLREPLFCKNCKRRDFRFVPDESEWTDVQRLQIQEPLELLEGGEEARQIEIWAEDDLTGEVTAGDKIAETGIMRLLPPRKKGSVYYKFLDANFIEGIEKEFEELEITKKEEREIKKLSKDPKLYDKVINSIAPSIYGYREIKEAIALQLFGGRTGKKLPDGTTMRPDLHILLIGEPGVAKSRILQYITQIAPKSIYVTGKGTTGAGLTVTAERDEFAEGAWTLKAGALILAGGGVACIDEFDKMNPEDRGAMHEALEQQSYHPSTEIMLSDGKTVKIGKLVDDLMEKNRRDIIEGKDCEILPVNDIELLTTDFHKIFKVKADRVSRHTAPDHFVRISYSNGRSITVTPEHPVYAFRDGRIVEVSAEEITITDLGIAPCEYPTISDVRNLTSITYPSNCKEIHFPTSLDKNLARLLGYIVTEGHCYYNEERRYAEIGVSNTDPRIISDVKDLFETIFKTTININYRKAEERARATKDLTTIRCSSLPLYRFFMTNFREIMHKARKKRIPEIVKVAPKEIQREFLYSAFKGDGFIDSERFGFSTSSEELAEDYQDLLLQHGVWSYISKEYRKREDATYYKVCISGTESMNVFIKNFVDRHDERLERLCKFYERSGRRLNYRDVIPTDIVKEVNTLLKEYNLSDGYFVNIINKGQNSHRRVIKRYLDKIERKISQTKGVIFSSSSREIRKNACIPLKDVARVMGLSVSMITYIERHNPKTKRWDELLETIRKLTKCKINRTKSAIMKLRLVVDSDVRFLKVKNVEKIDGDVKWVYDVTVEPTNNFISSGLILHNTVSVAKAGIVARFKANTSVLAASNPKFSRFDSYKPLAEQFDIPPTLLSRFDLIFPIKDILDKELDKEIADHMLKMHKTGEEMKELEPEIPTELFRKYIAYSRKNIHPVLSDDAAEKIKEYYVDLRSSGGEAVKATPRQLEALVRLAEASAKIRLSNTVTVSDAERAIKLTDFVLREIAYDESTGQIDIDRIVTDHPKSTRDRIRIIETIIQELINESGDGMASSEDIIAEAQSRGMDRFRAEQILIELKTKGVIYEPRHGRYMLTEG